MHHDWIAAVAPKPKPKRSGAKWSAEQHRARRAERKQLGLPNKSGTQPSKDVREKSRVRVLFRKTIGQLEDWFERHTFAPWENASPKGGPANDETRLAKVLRILRASKWLSAEDRARLEAPEALKQVHFFFGFFRGEKEPSYISDMKGTTLPVLIR